MRPAAPITGGALLALMIAAPAVAQPPIPAPMDVAWVAGKPIKQRDADRALRETLIYAADAATRRMGKPGAFARDTERRVPLPDSLRKLRGSWNDVGRSGALDALESAMNNAAEGAAPQARPVLLEAIGDIDFSDAVAIVRSGNEAASQFFAMRARAQVEARLRPIVEASLARSGAFTALEAAAKAADAPGRASEYRGAVIETTLRYEWEALLAEMRAEEREIRAAPEGRGSPLLRDVFSAWPEANVASAGG